MINRATPLTALILNVPILSLAAQSVWNGAEGDFNQATNWTPSGVPAKLTPWELNAGTATATGDDALFERGARTQIQGGALRLNNLRFLNGRDGVGDFRISSGSLQHEGTYFIIGQNSNGTFVQQGGEVNTNVSRGFFLSDGGGASSLLQISAGSFAVEMNGSYNSDLHNAWLGRGSKNGGANDRLVVDGGNFTVTNTAAGASGRWFQMCRNSSLLLEAGNVTLANLQAVTVGNARSGVSPLNTATMVLRGGTMVAEVRVAFVVGWGSNGSLGLRGGDLTIAKVNDTGGDLWIDGQAATTWATVEQTDGLLNVEGEVIIARHASGGEASYILAGGELRANNLRRGDGNHGRFVFTGGTLKLNGDRRSLINQSWFAADGPVTADYDASANKTTFTVDAPMPAPRELSLQFDGDFSDSSAAANHGITRGAASINTEAFGRVNGTGSLQLDGGAASRVQLQQGISFGASDPWTVSWWAQRSELGASKGMIIGERNSTGNFIWLRDSGAGGLRFRSATAASIDFLTPRDSAMRHYTLVADGSGQISLYLDGVLNETKAGLTAWTIDTIGEAFPTSSSNFNFAGWIDTLQVSPTALDADAVANLYAATAPDTSKPDPKRIRVILLAGQSNALGHAVANELAPELFFPQQDVELCNFFPDGKFLIGSLRPGLSRSGSFGPEVSLGRWSADHYVKREPNTRIAIIKYARGGTNLYSQWQAGGDDTSAGDGPEYLIFQDTVATGLAALAEKFPSAELSIEGMAWMQGEADCIDSQAPNYQANLTSFIADIRATYGADLPFVVGRLSVNQTNRQPGPLETVRAAQTAVAEADPRVALVKTDTFALLSDNLHFSTSGTLDMGRAFAENLAYLAWMKTNLPANLINQNLGDPSQNLNNNNLQNRLEWLFGFDPMAPHPGLQTQLTATPSELKIEINRVIPEGVFTLLEAPSPAGPWLASPYQPQPNTVADSFIFNIPKPPESQKFYLLRYQP